MSNSYPSINFNEVFYYEDGQLFWKVNRHRRQTAGKRAGYLQKDGYRSIMFNRKTYQEHRIIWEMFNEPIPQGLEIDHKNRNRSNNLLSNLRLATSAENSANTPCRHSNKTGYKGVSFNKAKNKYQAQITIKKQTKHLGYYKTPEEAGKVYAAESKLRLTSFSGV